MWVMYAFGSALFAGLTAILAKIGIKKVDSTVTTALRTTVVLVFAWLMVLVVGSGAELAHLDAKTWIFLILSGLATGASWLCYFKALYLGDVNKVAPVDKSSVILTMVLAVIFLGESLSWLKALCIVLIAAGTYLMIDRKKLPQKAERVGRGWLFYAVLSAVFAAVVAILGKIGIEGVESNLGTAIRTVVVLGMAWTVVLVTKKQNNIRNIDTKSAWFIVLSAIATGASWLCYFRALQEGPASIVVPIDKLSILVTVIFSYVFLHERMSRKSVAGLAIIVIGTLLLLV